MVHFRPTDAPLATNGKQLKNSDPGFTILELIVVIAGLGILSSLAVSNVTKYLDYTREDQASSLLNSIAADCLQKLRRDGNANSAIDANIMSYEKLKSFDYQFSEDKSKPKTPPTCASVSIGPSSQGSTSPIIGFNINDKPGVNYGKLTKRATDQGDKGASARWAGSNIKTNEEVERWRKLNEKITAAKKICLDGYSTWINNKSSGFKDTWNDLRTSKCSASPPDTPHPEFCTSAGCDKRVWALKGEICGYTPASYTECVARDKSAKCAAALQKIREDKDTTKISKGDMVTACDGDRYWFYEGEDTGSMPAWAELMCKREKQKLLSTTHGGPVKYCGDAQIYICGGKEITGANAKANYETCLANDKNAICTAALNEAAVSQSSGGPYTSPTPSGMAAPVGKDCNIKYWYCDNSKTIHREPGAKEKWEADEKCQNKCVVVSEYLCKVQKLKKWCCGTAEE